MKMASQRIYQIINGKTGETPEMISLNFDDYKGFEQYLNSMNFSYNTKVEKTLAQLVEQTENQSDLISEVASIKSKIQSEKSDDIQQYQSDITKFIEIELAKRYHFQEGKAYQRLKNDPEIEAAIELLGQTSKYNAILK